MELHTIDREIFDCNLCEGMVEKFFGEKTVSVGKKSDIVIVGEAPATNGWRKSGVAWYDVSGNLIPSGVVLQRLLKLIDYDIDDTYFLEAIKCYPLHKKYLKICSSNCRKYLLEQLRIINPEIILSLGDVATRSILDIKYARFGNVVGNIYNFDSFDVIPIYHPSPISPLCYNGNVDIFNNIIKKRIKK